MAFMKGLIIDTPAIDNILSGKKTWEMRASHTKVRGEIALIRKGSGTVVGVAELHGSIGPLCRVDLLASQDMHLISAQRLEDPKVEKWKFAWQLENARSLFVPVSYAHPSGAVIWVNLDEPTAAKVLQAAGG